MKNDLPIFNKIKSQEAKGICILIMLFHHFFAFPERLDNVFDQNILSGWDVNVE